VQKYGKKSQNISNKTFNFLNILTNVEFKKLNPEGRILNIITNTEF